MATKGRSSAAPRWTEQDLVKAGFIKNENTLGVIYYVNPFDTDQYWIKSVDNDKFWRQIPWHLVENPWENSDSPSNGRETETGQAGREVTAAALGEQIAAIYGEVRVGADIFFERLYNGNVYRAGYGLGHGEMESVQEMTGSWLGNSNYKFPNSYASWLWEFKNGTVNQTASQIIADAKGVALGACPVYPGLAYVAGAWYYHDSQLPSVPEDLKFLVRGRKCYDPRLDAGFIPTGVVTRNATTVVWTQNNALITADYLYNDWFGLGLGDTGIDWNTVITAADICDVVIAAGQVTGVTLPPTLGNYLGMPGPYTVVFSAAPPGGTTATGEAVIDPITGGIADVTITNPGSGYLVAPTWYVSVAGNPSHTGGGTGILGEKRHQMNIALRRKATHKANIETLRNHFRCSFVERQGKIAFVVDTVKASSYTFTKDNARAVFGASKGTSKVPTASVLTFTNPRKNWTSDQVQAYTDNVKFGIDEYRPAEWSLEGITRPNEANRQNSYLLGKQRANLNCQLELITTDGHELERGDRVTVIFDVLAMPSGVDFTLTSVKDNGNGRFLCDASYYNPALFTDTVGPVETVINLGIPDPYATLAAPTGLTAIPGVSQPHPGVYIPIVTVNFTRFVGSHYGGTKVTYQIGAGPETPLPYLSDIGPIEIPFAGQWGQSVTIRAYTVNRVTNLAGASVSSVVTLANPSSAFTFTPVLAKLTLDTPGSNGKPMLYFEPSQIRSTTMYGAASWTMGSDILPGYDKSKINNGSLADVAFSWSGGANGFAELDLGSAKTLQEFRVWWTQTNTSWSCPIVKVQYSDGGAFSDVPGTGVSQYHYSVDKRNTNETSGTGMREAARQWASVGAHRYWRFYLGGGAVTHNIYELQVYEWLGVFPYAARHDIFNVADGVERHFKSIPATYNAVTTPVDLSLIALTDSSAANAYRVVTRIRTVNILGDSCDEYDLQVFWTSDVSIVGELVTNFAVQKMSNKDVDNSNAITVKDTLFTLQDDGDATKQVKFQLSGVTAGATRTLTPPNASCALLGDDNVTGTGAVVRAASPTFTNDTFRSGAESGSVLHHSTAIAANDWAGTWKPFFHKRASAPTVSLSAGDFSVNMAASYPAADVIKADGFRLLVRANAAGEMATHKIYTTSA